MSRVCECGNEIKLSGKPGRPPIKCEECRKQIVASSNSESTRKRLSPQEIVDRLEHNLKSRGLHISRHREDEQ